MTTPAEAVQATVKAVQAALGLPQDGKYSRALHTKLSTTLAFPSADPPPIAALIDTLAMSPEDAERLQVAWAWWAVERERPIPMAAYQTLYDYNTQVLAPSGQIILTPETASVFVGDAPGTDWKTIGIVAALVLGTAGFLWYRHRVASKEQD